MSEEAQCGLGMPAGTYVPVGSAYRTEGDPLTGDPVWFNDAVSLPAGRYRVTYVRGSFRYGANFGWGVDVRWRVCNASGTNIANCPGVANPPPAPNGATGYGYQTPQLAEAAALAAATPVDFDHAGGKLGLRLVDSPYWDNTNGAPNPTFDLQRVEPCVPVPEAFPRARERCGIAQVPGIPDLQVVSECFVPLPPSPMVDCQDFDVPVPAPEVFVPCPAMQVDVTVISLPPGGTASADVQLQSTLLEDPCGGAPQCSFLLDFTFALPQSPQIDFPCPQFAVSSSVTNLPDGSEPTADVSIVRVGDPAACAFQFAFQFGIPETACPQITADSTVAVLQVGSTPTASVAVIGNEESCAFNFAFQFGIPDTACPQISADATVDVLQVGSTPTADVVVTAGEEACDFNFAFQFGIPDTACPQFAVTSSLSILQAGDTPQANVTLTRLQSEICAFQFAFQFAIPSVQCPQVTATTSVNVIQAAGDPTADVTVTRLQDEACGFNFAFQFGLPPPICPTVGATIQAYDQTIPAPPVSLQVTKVPGPDDCAFQFFFQAALPETVTVRLTNDCSVCQNFSYSWEEVVRTEAGAWTPKSGGRTSGTSGPALEFNDNTGAVSGDVVLARRSPLSDGGGGWSPGWGFSVGLLPRGQYPGQHFLMVSANQPGWGFPMAHPSFA